MAYSKLWCRLNKVCFTFTMTSSKTRPEGGDADSAQPTLLPGATAALLRKLRHWPWSSSPRPLWNPLSDGKVSHMGLSPQRQERGVSGMGLKRAPKEQAGHSGAGTIFSLKTQAKEGVSENTAGRGWFFSSHQRLSWCHLLKLGITSHLEGRWPRSKGQQISQPRERPTGLLLCQHRRLQLPDCPGSSALAWEMFQWKVWRFIYWAHSRHICWRRASFTYPSSLDGCLLIGFSFFPLTYCYIFGGYC